MVALYVGCGGGETDDRRSGGWHRVTVPWRPRSKESDPALRDAWRAAGESEEERVAAAPLGTVTVCWRPA